MKTLSLIFTTTLLTASLAAAQNKTKSVGTNPSIEQGRYLILVAGCNDCHTAMYAPKNGDIPEKEWLAGSPVGWSGPWGTTYATNLRQRVAGMTEEQWVAYLKHVKTLPPMPYYAVNAMNENDARSVYRFIRSLGNNSQKIPTAIPPGEKPRTPYVNFDVIPPQAAK